MLIQLLNTTNIKKQINKNYTHSKVKGMILSKSKLLKC